jgi:hypothetical protein
MTDSSKALELTPFLPQTILFPSPANYCAFLRLAGSEIVWEVI